MIIYNTTFIVPEELHDEFLDFVRNQFIHSAIASNIAREPRLSRVFSAAKDVDYSYAIEFKFDTIEKLEEWNKTGGGELQLAVQSKFRQKVLSFATLMQSLDL